MNSDQVQGLENSKFEDLLLIKETLALSSHILVRNPDQMAAQLLGRLLSEKSPSVKNMLAGCNQKSAIWLRPLSASLEKVTGARYRTLIGHTGSVDSLVVTPDSKRVISVSIDGTIRVWNIYKGIEEMMLRVDRGIPTTAALTRDGQQLIIGCLNGSLLIWEWRIARFIKTLTAHTGAVRSICCTPDDRYLISASDDCSLHIWDLSCFEVRNVLMGHTSSVKGVVITPDGKRIISASTDKTLRVWEFDSGFELAKMVSQWEQYSLAISPDGKTVVSGSEMVPIVWDLTTHAQSAILTDFNGPLHENEVNSVAISPDGNLAVSASGDWTLRVWNLKSDYPLRGASVPCWATHQASVVDVVITPDGRRAVSASLDKTIKVWNLTLPESGNSDAQSTSTSNPVKWIGFGPNKELICLDVGYKPDRFGEDPEWKSSLVIQGKLFDWYFQVRDLAQTADRKLLLVAVENSIDIIDVVEKETPKKGPFGIWRKIAISPDGQYALCYNWRSSILQFWNLTTGSIAVMQENSREVEALAITSGNIFGVVGNKDGSINIWHLPDLSQLQTVQIHTARVNILVPDRMGRLFSCGDDGMVHLWDPGQRAIGYSFPLNWSKSHCLVINENGQRMGVVSDDGAVQIWNIQTGKKISEFCRGSVKVNGVWKTEMPGKPLSNLVLFNQHHWAALNNGEIVKLWDLVSGTLIATFTGDNELETIAVSPDESKLYIGTVSGEIHQLVIEN
jgi:WD40 repeat protein